MRAVGLAIIIMLAWGCSGEEKVEGVAHGLVPDCGPPGDVCGYVIENTDFNRAEDCEIDYRRWYRCDEMVCDHNGWRCDSGAGRGMACFWMGQCQQTHDSCGDLGCFTAPPVVSPQPDGGIPTD